MDWRTWLAVAAVNAFIAVAAGAFGAHGLKERLSPADLAIFETGVRYHMYHALASVAVALLMSRAPTGSAQIAAWAFLIGIIVFSGSLYALPLSGVRKLGMITPIGGLSFLVGWAMLAVAAMRTPMLSR